MSASAGLGLDAGDDALLVAQGEELHTRADVRARADALLGALTQERIGRALVRSDHPLHILRAIDAADRAGADLYVAHTNIPEAYIDEIVARFGIGMLIGEMDRRTDAAGAGGQGRIFMMTSGTTGRPKIAAHTLDTLLARVRQGARAPANRDGRWLLAYQPTGFAGVQVQLTAVLARGLIVSPVQRTPAGFFEACRRHGVTQISATPTFWRSFLMAARPGELGLRQITLGGEAADQAILDRLKQAFPGVRITHIYASTEAGVVYAVHDGLEGFPAAWLDQPNVQGAQLRIRDGFLQIKTANAMRGYVTESAQPLLEDGWLATADRCEIVGDRVRVIGRDDSTINVGGSKVYPLAVESFLLKLPGVVEARVFGEANPISGFLVAAEVVLEAGEDAKAARARIMAACREGLAQYQVPRVLKFVDAIATRASGKKG